MTANLANDLLRLGSLASLRRPASGAESAAVRAARAAFTTPPTTPPWAKAAAGTPVSAEVSAIKALKTIVDETGNGASPKLRDVETTFTAYKALERLRRLAEAATGGSISAVERKSLQQAFAGGLADLQAFLGRAPTDKLTLSFGVPTHRAQSIAISREPTDTLLRGASIAASRTTPLPGITGQEKLRIDLSRFSERESITVDLASTPQPPTIDSVVAAINAAIAAVPARDASGNPIVDASGSIVPRWQSRFQAVRGPIKDGALGDWGLAVDVKNAEQVALDQPEAPDALVVASGRSGRDIPDAAQILRFDDPAGTLSRSAVGTITAVDREATERAALARPTGAPAAAPVAAPLDVRAIATDAQGFSYVVGTTAGDLGANRSHGENDLFLVKLDSDGRQLWQRTLGVAGAAEGAAVSIAPGGDIVVAGTIRGPFNGALGIDSDLLVARFDSTGDERFATAIRALGDQSASALAVSADGQIYVGGKASAGTGSDAFLARVSADGRLAESRTLAGTSGAAVNALAIGGGGELLALTREDGTARVRRIAAGALQADLGAIDLGAADARTLAVSATGEIAVAGATSSAVTGAQVNGLAGGTAGFVTRIDGALTSASTTYVGSTGDSQIDSLAFAGDTLYLGGRTEDALDGPRRGDTDGFVSRVDAATGLVERTSQFGLSGATTGPVRVAVAPGSGGGLLRALGLGRGPVGPADSLRLDAQTSLRAGDSFSIRIDDGAAAKITIAADETLTSLAAKVRTLVRAAGTVTTPESGGRKPLQLEAGQGHSIELIAGPRGTDVLAKLGLAPARLAAKAPVATGKTAPAVRPGGAFGLELSSALGLTSAKDAAVAVARLSSAISTTQSAYRSLYWDASKERLVSGAGLGSPHQRAQLARYQAALERLTGSA